MEQHHNMSQSGRDNWYGNLMWLVHLISVFLSRCYVGVGGAWRYCCAFFFFPCWVRTKRRFGTSQTVEDFYLFDDGAYYDTDIDYSNSYAMLIINYVDSDCHCFQWCIQSHEKNDFFFRSFNKKQKHNSRIMIRAIVAPPIMEPCVMMVQNKYLDQQEETGRTGKGGSPQHQYHKCMTMRFLFLPDPNEKNIRVYSLLGSPLLLEVRSTYYAICYQ